jgi:hypothetical protein
MLNGPNNYGATCRTPDGKAEFYCILGTWFSDAEGLPAFNQLMMDTVIHEFCHSYANPVIDHRQIELRAAGETLFAGVAAAMQRQAYGNWKTMLYESLVRACTIRHVHRYRGAVAAWWRTLDDRSRGFEWIGELSDLLGEYESQRDRYPTLDSFSPRIVAFFNQRAQKSPRPPGRSSFAIPRIVSISPTDGATDMDPGLTRIRVVFDRPMRNGSWSLVGDAFELPEVAGKPSYDAQRTTWTTPVRLKPGSSYRFMLNSENYHGFQSQDGVPLDPVTVRFKTR